MIEISVPEYGVLPGVALDADQRDALLTSGGDFDLAPTRGLDGRYDIRASSFVGVVQIPGLSIRIRPKIAIARLFTMLSVASGAVAWREERTHFAEDAAIEDVVAMALADAIHDRMKTGLLRGYEEREEESTIVRGRLDLAETLRRRPALFMPFVQSPDVLDEDVAENRVVRSAVDCMLPRVGSARVRGRLLDCQRLFAGVALPATLSDIRSVRPNRLNRRWWEAIALALLVLRAHGLDLPQGAVGGRSFLVDMNVVFERFVHRRLAEALRMYGLELRHGHRGLHLDLDGHHELIPDLSVWRGERCLFVGDCKYKHTEDAIADRNDVYQALAYTTAAGVPRATLVYGEGARSARDMALVDGKTLILVRVLDLSASIERLKHQFRKLARELADATTASIT